MISLRSRIMQNCRIKPNISLWHITSVTSLQSRNSVYIHVLRSMSAPFPINCLAEEFISDNVCQCVTVSWRREPWRILAFPKPCLTEATKRKLLFRIQLIQTISSRKYHAVTKLVKRCSKQLRRVLSMKFGSTRSLYMQQSYRSRCQ